MKSKPTPPPDDKPITNPARRMTDEEFKATCAAVRPVLNAKPKKTKPAR